jgi:hypothetical protein
MERRGEEMKVVKRRFSRRLALGAGLVGIGAIVAALALGVASTGSAGTGNIPKMTVAPTSKVLRACTAEPCGPETTVRNFLYVENKNPLPPSWDRDTQYTRATLPGAFVMSSIDLTVFVNGELLKLPGFENPATPAYLPPPDIPTSFPGAHSRLFAGQWPSTVTCPDTPDPCNVVKSPAIVPGETTVAFWARWTHDASEPNGKYVFRFTIHGTLDGAPVDLRADSPTITMTD